MIESRIMSVVKCKKKLVEIYKDEKKTVGTCWRTRYCFVFDGISYGFTVKIAIVKRTQICS